MEPFSLVSGLPLPPLAWTVGPWEIVLVVLAVVVVFGAGKLKTLGGDLGEGIKNFKKAMKGDDDDGSSAPAPRPRPELRQPSGERDGNREREHAPSEDKPGS